MAIPRALSPSYWLDCVLTVFLKLVLAVLLKTLSYVKGEDAAALTVTVNTIKNSRGSLHLNTSLNDEFKAGLIEVEKIRGREFDDVKAREVDFNKTRFEGIKFNEEIYEVNVNRDIYTSITDEIKITEQVGEKVVETEVQVDEIHFDGFDYETEIDEVEVNEAHVDEVQIDEVEVNEAHVDDVHVAEVELEEVDEVEVEVPVIEAEVDEVHVAEAEVDEVEVDEVHAVEAEVDEVEVEVPVIEAEVDEVEVNEVAEAEVDEVEVDEVEVNEVEVDEVHVAEAEVDEVEVEKTIEFTEKEVAETEEVVITETVETNISEVEADKVEVEETKLEQEHIEENLDEEVHVNKDVETLPLEPETVADETLTYFADKAAELTDGESTVVSDAEQEEPEPKSYPEENEPKSYPEENEPAQFTEENTNNAPSEMKTSHEPALAQMDNNIVSIDFYWKHGGNKVVITGDFDNWQATNDMTKLPNGEFVATISIDRNKEHTFKFVIDNDWQCNPDYQTKRDQYGNENNTLSAFPTDIAMSEFRSDIATSSLQLATAF